MKLIYEPAEDSYFLESIISKYAKGKSVLDMGTGSGILARKARLSGAKSVIAVDINSEAVKNLRKEKIKSLKSNLFKKVKGKFDLILCNPPYLPEDKDEDQESSKITSGGKNGDEFILKFIAQSKKHLNKNGVILLLTSSLTPEDKINELINNINFKKSLIASKKIFFEMLYIWKIEHNPKIF